MEVSRKDIVFLALGLLPALVVAVAAFLFVPSSLAVYAPVLAQLPAQTRFVFSTYYLCALLPVLVVCVWYFWRNISMRGPVAAGVGIFSSIAILAFGWWALYQPVLILQLIKQTSR